MHCTHRGPFYSFNRLVCRVDTVILEGVISMGVSY
jgi:hypothetical protein